MVTIIRKMRFWTSIPGRAYSKKSGHYKEFAERLAEEVRAKTTEPSLSDQIEIHLDFFHKSPTMAPDVDNATKAVLDALKTVLYVDDSQVRSIHARTHIVDDVIRLQRDPLALVEPLIEGCEEYIVIRVY